MDVSYKRLDWRITTFEFIRHINRILTSLTVSSPKVYMACCLTMYNTAHLTVHLSQHVFNLLISECSTLHWDTTIFNLIALSTSTTEINIILTFRTKRKNHMVNSGRVHQLLVALSNIHIREILSHQLLPAFALCQLLRSFSSSWRITSFNHGSTNYSTIFHHNVKCFFSFDR